jgi:formylglycine-generating enzyme required for sulfatase activity
MNIETLLPSFIPIPSVPFRMGTPERELSALAKAYGGTRESYREESPQHTLTLPAFAIARTPVTNALYAAYVAATGARAPIHWRGAEPPMPWRRHDLLVRAAAVARLIQSASHVREQWLELLIRTTPQLE